MTRDLTHDGFLGGRIKAWQPRDGYRAATDPVFLAAACSARAGEKVLELGCGVGVASLCLSARVPGLCLTGVEVQPIYADLARRNAAEAGVDMRVVTADITALPHDLLQESFDHVLTNPPYYAMGAGTAAANTGRERALREDTPLATWVDVAKKRLKPKGWLTLILASDRLSDALSALQNGFGGVTILPLSARVGRPAKRIVIRARKGGKAPLQLLSPFLIHEGMAHMQDGDDFTSEARAILRDGAQMPWTAA